MLKRDGSSDMMKMTIGDMMEITVEKNGPTM